jgi:HSP20 family molecular chaperone IbpA
MDTITSQGKEAGPDADAGPQSVPVNVYETTDALVIVAAMPAVQAEDISIELTDAMVRLTADLRSSAPKTYLVQEWAYGGYQRDVVLPHGFAGPAVASFGNGQLAVRILRDGSRAGGGVTVQPASATDDRAAPALLPSA